jgi:type IV pilus assembly protein PilM
MAILRNAWGIDIGNQALKAVRLTREGDGLKVQDVAYIPHDTPLNESGDNRDDLIRQSLARFAEQHDTRKVAFAVGVGGSQVFSKFIKLPPVEDKELPKIVKFEAVQQIPFPLDDVEWGYQLFRKPDDVDVEVGIFAMRRELVNSAVSHFTDLDLDVQLVQADPVAVYNGVQHDGRLVKGAAMILDMGTESTDLIIADDHTLWTSTVGIGGAAFTEAIQEAFKVDEKKAERLKHEARSSKYSRQIFQAMRPVFSEFVGEVQRRMGFYTSTHKDVRIRKVIPMGGGFKLPMLAKYLNQNLNMPVDRPDRFLAEPPEDGEKKKIWDESLLQMGAAYGLAVQVMGDGAVTSTLLPEHIRNEKLWKDKTKWFAAAAGLMLAGAGLVGAKYFYDDFSFAAAEGDQREVDRVISEAGGLASSWTSDVQDVGGPQQQTIRNVFSLTDYQTLWAQLAPDLIEAMPEPQEQVAQGLAEGDAELVKQVPRNQRDLVLIESWESRYTDNLASVVNAPDFTSAFNSGGTTRGSNRGGGGGGGGGVAAPQFGGMGEMDMMMYNMEGMGGMPQQEEPEEAEPEVAGADDLVDSDARGFLVTLNLVSPKADAANYVNNVVIPRLKEIAPDPQNPNLRYRVVEARVFSPSQFESNPQRLSDLEAAFEKAKAAIEGEVNIGGSVSTGRFGNTGVRPGNRGFQGGPGEFGGMDGSQFFPGMEGMDQIPGMNNRPGNRNNRGNDRNRPGIDVEAGGDIYGETAAADAPYADRLTGESRLDDWEIVVLLAIEIDPPKFDAADEDGDEIDPNSGELDNFDAMEMSSR